MKRYSIRARHQGHMAIPLLSMALWAVVGLEPAASQRTPGRNPSGPEWPVFFEHLGFVHSIHNKWDLSISVRLYLPALDARITKSLHRLSLLSGAHDHVQASSDDDGHFYDDYLELQEEFQKLQGNGTDSSPDVTDDDGGGEGPSVRSTSSGDAGEVRSRLQELQESWITLNRHLRRKCWSLRRRSRSVRNLGGSGKIQQGTGFTGRSLGGLVGSLGRRRVRRQSTDNGSGGGSLIPGFGRGVLQTLFGIAYMEDVSNVLSKLEGLNQDLSVQLNSVKSETGSLRSLTDSELVATKAKMGVVEEMAHSLERKVADMETNPFLRSPIANLVKSKTEIYNNLQLELDLVESRLAEVERAVAALASGRLDKDIMSPSKLRHTLFNIEKQLPGNYTLLFSPNDAMWPYYSLLGTSVSFDPDMEVAIVQLRIPLLDLSAILDLHRVHNLPLKVRDGYSVTADITTEYLVTDSTKVYYLELQKDDFQDCQVFQYRGMDHFYCGFGPMFRADSMARSCVMQLYRGSGDTSWCQSRLNHGYVQPFTRLYNGSWIFSALQDKISVNLKCPEGDTPTALMGFGVLNLSEGCTISSKEFWYPHTYAGAIGVSLEFGDKGWDNTDFHTDASLADLFNSTDHGGHGEATQTSPESTDNNLIPDGALTITHVRDEVSGGVVPLVLAAVEAEPETEAPAAAAEEASSSSTSGDPASSVSPETSSSPRGMLQGGEGSDPPSTLTTPFADASAPNLTLFVVDKVGEADDDEDVVASKDGEAKAAQLRELLTKLRENSQTGWLFG